MPDGLEDIFTEVSTADAGGVGEVNDNPDAGTVEVETPNLEISAEEADVFSDDGDVQVENDDETGDTGQSESFDWQQYADSLVPIVVDGVEEMVPLAELRNGYMRQSDYTRKTQTVAELERQAQWAQDVQAFFDADPVEALRVFAKHFQIDPTTLTGQAAPVVDDRFQELDPEFEPVVNELRAAQQRIQFLEAQFEQQAQQAVVAEVKQEIQVLQSEFGSEFDPKETLVLAAQRNLPLRDAHFLRQAYLQAQRRTAVPQVEASTKQAAQEAQRQAEVKRQEAKRQASSAATKSYRAVEEIAADDFNDIAELFEMVQNSA